MIAIIVDALRAVPRVWTEGAAALGVNRWRAMWTISVRAARPAIIAAAVLATARALGEAIMLSMVSGERLRAQPARRPDVLLRADAPARATIVDNAEALSVAAVRPDDLRVRRRAARLERDAVVRRLGSPSSRCRSTGSAPDGASAPSAAESSRDVAACRPHRPRAVLGRRHRAVRDRRGDRPLHGCQGAAVPALRSCSSTRPNADRRPDAQPAASSTRSSARCCIARRRIAIARAARRRASRVWLTEYGRPRWLARAVESGVEVIAGTPRIVLAIFGLIVFQEAIFGLAVVHRRGRRGRSGARS